jgi:hypothetical protein
MSRVGIGVKEADTRDDREVRVPDLRRQLSFVEETAGALFGGELGLEHSNRDRARQPPVLADADDPHTAASDLAVDGVARRAGSPIRRPSTASQRTIGRIAPQRVSAYIRGSITGT